MEAKLKSFGCTNISQLNYEWAFDYNSYSWVASDAALEEAETIDDLLADSDRISCCGDIVNDDNLICPTCKEHL